MDWITKSRFGKIEVKGIRLHCGEKSHFQVALRRQSNCFQEEYIFLRLDKVGRNGNEDRLFFHEKVSFFEIVGKKDKLSNRVEWLSDQAK